ncbi:MAG: ATP:cob(I)alamin adenosyltransferase, partial [Clostridia bacterium]|nr:ATP:cob(I)alamin adenosyltransferase [Clostridia bacterium]
MILTKGGDGGFSTLSSNMKISKDDERFYALGDLEELSGHLELCKVLSSCDKFIGNVERIQKDVLKIADSIKQPGVADNNISEKEIDHLESEIDRCKKVLEGNNTGVEVDKNEFYARIKLTGAVCRRAERDIVKAGKRYFVTSEVKAYMNRL